MLLAQLQCELRQLHSQIEDVDAVIMKVAHEHEACQRLMAIPGIGPVIATAIVSAIGNGAEFKKGRGFAAWLGLVPAQYSTGGKQKLLGISKRGNCYLRSLLVHGARAVMQCREKQSSGLSAWLGQLASRVHCNVPSLPWPTNWPAWPGLCWPREKRIGRHWRPTQLLSETMACN
jgi:transposase